MDSEHYLTELWRAESFDHALDILQEITDGLGFTQVLYAYLPTPARLPSGEWQPLKLNVRNFPAGWETGWREFMAVDPYYHACFGGTLPFEWATVQQSDQLKPLQRRAWHYLADFGLARGMTIPVHLPFGKFAVISAIADASVGNWDHLRDAAWETMFKLTHEFHRVVHERGFESQVDVIQPAQLTPREIECLYWAAAGKTSSDIAIILDRSIETVRLHIKNAILRLEASNRSHAVAKAVQLGILNPNAPAPTPIHA